MSELYRNSFDEIREMKDEIERLTALTKADGKEIGSYRDGTGLRGENATLMDRIKVLEDVLYAARPLLNDIGPLSELREAIAAADKT